MVSSSQSNRPVNEESYAARRRLAWLIVMAGFAIFTLIVLSIPIMVSRFLQDSVRLLHGETYANQGILSLQAPNESPTSLYTIDGPGPLGTNYLMRTGVADTGYFTVQLPDTDVTLIRGQIYTNSLLQFPEISTPRFQLSNRSNEIALQLEQGRLRLTVFEYDLRRSTDIEIAVPQGRIAILAPGEYSFETVGVETQVSVLAGEAEIKTDLEGGSSLVLTSDQRGELRSNQPPFGPYSAERNLVRNSDFSDYDDGWSNWTGQEWAIQMRDQPSGATIPISLNGDDGIRFRRQGIGAAETSILQIIDRDTSDLEELTLVVGIRVNDQSLEVCGSRGSECPLMVRIEYEDESGTNRIWQQGFYANGGSIPGPPKICETCPQPTNVHRSIPLGRLFIDEIDILQSLRQKGMLEPIRIESLEVEASGHAFEVDLFEIGIRAKEFANGTE